MITTEFFHGQGFGNQLFVYASLRAIAEKNGYEWGIQSPERFKGHGFMNVDMGTSVLGGNGPEGGPPSSLPNNITNYYREYRHAMWTDPELRTDLRLTDKNLFAIQDNTKVDGLLQSEDYFGDSDFRQWFKVNDAAEHQETNDHDLCVLNFRGGEVIGNAGCWVPRSYWDNAIRYVLSVRPNMKFIVVTDDVAAANNMLPEFPAYHKSIAWDFVALKNCRNIICSTSTFACFPLWMNTHLDICIAPKYWFHHNLSQGWWSLGCSIYSYVTHYMDRTGEMFTVDYCRKEWDDYMKFTNLYRNELNGN